METAPDDTLWQKIKLWSKIVILGLVLLHALLFIFLNLGTVIEPRLSLIYKTYDRPNFLVVTLVTSVVSIFGWWMFWLVFRTLRQIREVGTRARTDRLEREMEQIKQKAAMLQTRPDADPRNTQIRP
ncbi:MAG TPA: hypothetical protein VK324_16995 [Tepidisphaeraceae bacterium]|nr:hypothetical protein [Tepidisphaeraceae bacterium]